MESKVKSQLVNKTYTSQLDKIEDDDRDANSELYRLPVSGTNILVAPGKSIMSDSGVAYCYVYVIQQERVICKLGVYEKKTETMPMFFDLSTFPEGSMLLFEEYEMNPSKLLDFAMKEPTNTLSNNIFDYLIRELFPKVQDKKKKLNDTYGAMYPIYKKVEKSLSEWGNDNADTKARMKKELDGMKTILKLISAARKVDPTEEFLLNLKEKATDPTKLALSLVTLQPFFDVTFEIVSNDQPADVETQRRWSLDSSKKNPVLKVDAETHTLLSEETAMSVISEETMENSIRVKEPDVLPEEYNPEPEVEEQEVIEPEAEEPEVIEPESEEPEEELEVTEPVMPTRPTPVRRGQTPKLGVTKKTKAPKSEIRGTSMNAVFEPAPKSEIRGTSMNAVFEPTVKPLETGSISLNEEEPTKKPNSKIKMSKLKTKPKTRTKSESIKE